MGIQSNRSNSKSFEWPAKERMLLGAPGIHVGSPQIKLFTHIHTNHKVD